MNRKKKLSCQKAEQKIREIATYGYISPTSHILDQMEDRNYHMNDLILVLTKGKVRETPEFDKKYNNWKYKVEGTAIEGDTAIIVVAITGDRDQQLRCITIWDK